VPPARAAALATALSIAAFSTSVSAGDGAYGRLDGDLDLSLGAGAALTAQAPAFVARASAVYVATAGVYVGYADTFGQRDARFDRSIAAGISLKPLFWARFANAAETGPARLDLFIDSLAIELGAFWAAPHGHALESSPGLELALGLGFPLFSEASGPFIEVRGALRFRSADLSGRADADLGERGALLSLTIAWHQIVAVHLADAGDRLLR